MAGLATSPSDNSGRVLWIINSRSNINAAMLRVREGHDLVVTSNWHVHEVFRRAGRSVACLDDLLDEAALLGINAFVKSIVTGWYRFAGRDFTEVDGISLGRVDEFDHTHCMSYPTESLTATKGIAPFVRAMTQFVILMARERPACVVSDVEDSSTHEALVIASEHFGIPLERLETSRLAEQMHSLRGRAFQFLRRAVALLLVAKRLFLDRVADAIGPQVPRVAFVPYPCLAHFVRQQRHNGFTMVDLSCWSQSSAPRPWLPRRLSHEHDRIRLAWNRLKSDPHYLSQFLYMGVKCERFFLPFFERTVCSDFRRTLLQSRSLRSVFHARDIRAVVVPFDEPRFSRLAVLVAQKEGIPSIVVQHGVMNLIPNPFNHDELCTADVACVFSENDAGDLRQRRGHLTDCRVIGCLQLDRYIGPSASQTMTFRDNGTRDDRLHVLILGQTTGTQGNRTRATEPERYLAQVIEGLNVFADRIEVTLKLHPADDPQRYDANLPLMRGLFLIHVASGWRLSECLATCDLVIMPVSTSLGESLACGKPVIYFRSVLEPDPRAFTGESGLPVAHTADELTALVRLAVEDLQKYKDQYPFRRALASFGPADGQATKRLAAVVRHYCNVPRLRR